MPMTTAFVISPVPINPNFIILRILLSQKLKY